MAYIEAERFAELKARVKAECLRRCHTGSVAEYGGEKYEYTNSPTEDHTVDVEHYEKLALPLSKIHSEKVPSLDGRRIVFDEDITEFEAALTLFETRPMTDKTRLRNVLHGRLLHRLLWRLHWRLRNDVFRRMSRILYRLRERLCEHLRRFLLWRLLRLRRQLHRRLFRFLRR